MEGAQTLDLVDGAALGRAPRQQRARAASAAVCGTLDEVRDLAARAPEIAHSVRAVLAPFIPSGLVSLLSAAGIAALRVDAAAAKKLEGQKTIALPAPVAVGRARGDDGDRRRREAPGHVARAGRRAGLGDRGRGCKRRRRERRSAGATDARHGRCGSDAASPASAAAVAAPLPPGATLAR